MLLCLGKEILKYLTNSEQTKYFEVMVYLHRTLEEQWLA
jgi:hypothetical protein